MKLNHKLTVLIFVFALAVSGITSFVLYRTAADQVMKDIRRRLLDIVAISAANLDGELHATLTDPAQEDGNAYIAFRSRLQQIRNASTDIHFIYTMRKGPEGGIVFAVDAETDPEKTAHLGEVYTTPSKLLAASFSELKHPVVEADFYTDEWGTWLSGYAPFFRKDGTRAGVIGVDISAGTVKEYQQQMLRHAGITFLCILPFILIVGFLTGRKIAGPIIMMKEVAERMGHGDLDHRIMIGRSDEIGILAGSLNEMAAKLKAGKKELEYLAKKYRNIFDHASEGIFQTTPEGRLITANPALAQMMGYASVQSMMESITDLENQFYADSKDRLIFMESLEKEDRVNNFQTVFKRRDGTVFPVELNARLIAEKGEQKLFEGIDRK
ncbi:PAS domain S-box protein, partial [Desulfobacter sp.]|uniref:PAS domain S-box protein n=1 Tax=Desulfobacter sp. TaxID=2294 RepID=UPI003D122F0B